MQVRTAVIPAAGLGTRFLPATKAVPKELLPIVDTPALQLIIDEAVGAGIDHIVIVTSRNKPAIEAYFRRRRRLIAKLRRQGQTELADRLARSVATGGSPSSIRTSRSVSATPSGAPVRRSATSRSR